MTQKNKLQNVNLFYDDLQKKIKIINFNHEKEKVILLRYFGLHIKHYHQKNYHYAGNY